MESVDWIELVGEAEDGRAAIRLINKMEPDIAFLDVQMPELTGLEVLENLEHKPAIVFTTAYDRYAAAAFELEAIDYLVKPFGSKRFRSMLDRVKQRLPIHAADVDPVTRAQEALTTGPLRRMFARKGNRIVQFSVESTSRIEAGDNYINVYAEGQTFLLNMTLNDIGSRLDPNTFLRVHRSHIVSLDHVVSMRSYDERRLALTMDDGEVVIASRAGSQLLRGLVN